MSDTRVLSKAHGAHGEYTVTLPGPAKPTGRRALREEMQSTWNVYEPRVAGTPMREAGIRSAEDAPSVDYIPVGERLQNRCERRANIAEARKLERRRAKNQLNRSIEVARS